MSVRQKIDSESCDDPMLRQAKYEDLIGLVGRFTITRDGRITTQPSGMTSVEVMREHSASIDPQFDLTVFRDIVYNPFQPSPAFDEDWLFRNDNAVYLLAQDIYYDYRFDLMPRLADALEKAGCTDAIILDHCRAANPHFRGCWVIDGLLKPDVDPLKRLLSRNPIPGDRLRAYLLSDDPKDPFSLYRG
jgi:hypothetical protein